MTTCVTQNNYNSRNIHEIKLVSEWFCDDTSKYIYISNDIFTFKKVDYSDYLLDSLAYVNYAATEHGNSVFIKPTN